MVISCRVCTSSGFFLALPKSSLLPRRETIAKMASNRTNAASSSRNEEKPHRSTRRSDGAPSSEAPKEPRRRELMVFWRCCECHTGPMTKGTNKVCTNNPFCQHVMCQNCRTKEKVIYPLD